MKTLLCIESYSECEDEFWTKGRTYPANFIQNEQTGESVWEVETNFGTTGCIGKNFLVTDISELFIVQD